MNTEEQNLRIEFHALDLKEEKLKIDLEQIRNRKRDIAKKFADNNFELTLADCISKS